MSKFAGLGIAAEKPARMTILHPATGEPLVDAQGEPAWIDLLSLDSPAALKQERAARNRRMTGRVRRMTSAELDAEADEMFAAVTAAWRLLTLAGEPLDIPCTPANALELYAEPTARWLREQVNVFLGDRGNFIRT